MMIDNDNDNDHDDDGDDDDNDWLMILRDYKYGYASLDDLH